jgi:hypothetical protein
MNSKALAVTCPVVRLHKIVKLEFFVGQNNLIWETVKLLTSKTPVTSMRGISSAFTQ